MYFSNLTSLLKSNCIHLCLYHLEIYSSRRSLCLEDRLVVAIIFFINFHFRIVYFSNVTSLLKSNCTHLSLSKKTLFVEFLRAHRTDHNEIGFVTKGPMYATFQSTHLESD